MGLVMGVLINTHFRVTYGNRFYTGGVAMEQECKTMTVPQAGREYFGLGRNASYEAARRGDIPTIRIGRLLRVPIVALDRKLNGTKGDER